MNPLPEKPKKIVEVNKRNLSKQKPPLFYGLEYSINKLILPKIDPNTQHNPS